MLKKLESKGEKKKRQRRNQLIVGIILIAIMVLSTAGYSIMDRSQKEENAVSYKNFEFIKAAAGWQIQKQDFSLVTRYLPKDAENVSYEAAIPLDSFNNKEIYFVAFSDDSKMAANEIARNLPVLRAQLACLEQDANKTECADLPLKNCQNPVFVFDEKRFNNTDFVHTRIYQNENCIIIESLTKNLMLAADRLLFGIYGVM